MRFISLALVAATLAVAPVSARAPVRPAPVETLVKQVDIPHERFVLGNGLRVLVHTDRKAPVVAVSIWYDVGSKHEPQGKTGFAHLFEHLMFNGSENADGDYFKPLESLGATNFNGTTSFDRTNYYQTVPTGALDRVLFLESDRMGYLLGAVTPEKLANQIGVVQNEKRQRDNQPYGLVSYAQIKGTVPAGHPYGHSIIGSMADLDAASMDDVRAWFRQHYGPNNAVLVLSGDIDVKTAKPLVEKWFGRIPAGPKQARPNVPIPTLDAPKAEVLKDRVATVRLSRSWTVPGLDHADLAALRVGAAVLGGLASSRLDNALVRKEQLAVNVSTSYVPYAQMGWFEVAADVRPGVDPAAAAQRLDALVADFIKTGPTEDEVARVVTRSVAARIDGLEQAGGKAAVLAEGELYRADSNAYKKDLLALGRVTPADVRKALSTWITRPAFSLSVLPGERDAYEESRKSTPQAAPAASPVVAAQAAQPTRAEVWPAVGAIADLTFPKVERTRLSNGVPIVFVQRIAVPMTQVSISFDVGNAADSRSRPGTQSLMLSLLDEGAAGLTSTQIAEAQERLGASIGAGASMDTTTIGLSALSANLDPSLDLLADVTRRPDFVPAEVERLRRQQLARIQSELTNPQAIALRTLPPLLYGTAHSYGTSFTGSGDVASVSAVTRDELLAFHQQWIRPDKATIFVVSDQPLDRIKPALDARFGDWRATGSAGVKAISVPAIAPARKIVLVDRPGSPQSLILAGQVLPKKGTDDLEALMTANQALGSGFLSRINMDLRETKGWSYGVRGMVSRVVGDVPYMIFAPVQADRTGDSIAALRTTIQDFLSKNGITAEEVERIITGSIRELPGSFETGEDVLGAVQRNALYNRADDFYDRLASRYRAMTQESLDASIRSVLKPDDFLWVVVGDAKNVRPQLEKLGLPVDLMSGADGKSASAKREGE